MDEQKKVFLPFIQVQHTSYIIIKFNILAIEDPRGNVAATFTGILQGLSWIFWRVKTAQLSDACSAFQRTSLIQLVLEPARLVGVPSHVAPSDL